MTYRPDPLAIELPDGRVATEREMRNVGRMLQLFVRTTEERLPRIEDTQEHDRIVDFLHRLANAYNEQLRLFRQAQQARERQRAMLLALCIGQWSAGEDGTGTATRH